MSAELTPEQKALQDKYVEEYIKVGTRTDRITQENARLAAAGLYKLNKVPLPDIIEIHPGPRAAWEAVIQYATPAKLPNRQVVIDELRKEIIYPAYEGNFNAGFLAYAEYMKELGVPMPEAYEHYRHARNVHLIWPLPEACILCDFPTVCNIVNNRLHCTDGPAFAYADGTKIWVIDGVGVDEQIVMDPGSQTIEQIDGDTNADRRAIRIERLGWPRYLHMSGAVLLDEGANEVEGTYEVLYQTKDSCRLVATCTTGRIMTMGLPGTIKTRQEAQVWLRGEDKINVIGRT